MIKYCSECKKNNNPRCKSGYSYWWKDDVKICPWDNTQLVDIDFDAKDLSVICEISENTSFIEAMIKLHDSDIIEYETKMSQFRTQVVSQEQENSNVPTCPYCKSTNIKKISTSSRMLSTGFWGLGSGKVGKQWHCNQCGSDF